MELSLLLQQFLFFSQNEVMAISKDLLKLGILLSTTENESDETGSLETLIEVTSGNDDTMPKPASVSDEILAEQTNGTNDIPSEETRRNDETTPKQTSGHDETTNVETSGNHETPTNQVSDTEETLLKQATGNDDPAPEETSGNEETQPIVTDVSDETSPQEGSGSDGTPPEWLMYAHPVFHQLLAGFYASRKITVAESMVTYIRKHLVTVQ